jgi:branched-chain amino acid transport system substrate-binding protein
MGSLLRPLGRLLSVACVCAASVFVPTAQAADPIKIGLGMALTGGLAGNGKAGVLAIKMWADDINARGGLLGRKVEIVYYDDQSNPSTVPGIYTKLLDVDKVDLVVSPYGTNLIAPIMPIVMGRGLTMVSFFGLSVNDQFKYDRYFQMMPMVAASVPTAFFDTAMALNPKPQTVALTGADAEFGKIIVDAAREIAKKHGLKIVYDRAYPPATVDFAPVVRGIQASKADLVFVGSYPPDSVGMIRAANEIGLKAMMFGGGTVGLQFAAIKSQLGPLLNGVLSYEFYVPSATIKFPGIDAFLKAYQGKAAAEGVDPLGFYIPPYVYAGMQVIEQAVSKAGSLDQKKIADIMHSDTFSTVVGDVKFAATGEWATPRPLLVQYQGVATNTVDEFRQPGKVLIVYPPQFKSGDLKSPFGEK